MMPKWLRISLKLLGMLFAISVAAIPLIGIWWHGGFNPLFPHEVATYESPDSEYTLVFEQLGDAQWPFGPADVRLTLKNSRGRVIERVSTQVYNDGASAHPKNIKSIHWGENEIVVILGLQEVPDQEIIISLP